MKLNTKEIELLKKLCKQYITTKELVTEAEEFDSNSGANIQINKEFRDTLSHLIRVFGDQLLNDQQKYNSDNNYYTEHINKAIGHTYRAGYDSMDGIAISLREKINTISEIPKSIITQVLHNYAERIERLDKFHNKLMNFKKNKDVGNDSTNAFSECILEMKNIKESMNGLGTSIGIMKEIQLEKEKEKTYTKKQTYFLTAIGVVIGGIISFILSV